MSLRSLIVALALSGVACGSHVRAQASAPVLDQESRVALVKELHELAAWCRGKRLTEERTAVLSRVIRLDPEDGRARRALGHRKRGGRWEPPARSRGKTTTEAARARHGAAFEQRLSQALLPLVNATVAAWQREGSGVTRAQWEELLLDAPDDVRIRSALGEVRHDDRWILARTRSGMRRWKALMAERDRLLAELPAATSVAAMPEVARLGLQGSRVARSGQIRVTATTSGDVGEVARRTELARLLAEHWLGCKRALPAPYRVVLFEASALEQFLRHPGFEETEKPFARTMKSSWATISLLGCWGDTAEIRLDSTVRQTIATALLTQHGVSTQHGWITEGFGLYLSHAAIGTRLTIFAQPGNYDSGSRKDFERRLREPNADWMQLALEVLSEKRHPDLVTILGKNVNDMDGTEVLLAHALAGLLLETCSPIEVSRLLTRCGNGEEPAVLVVQDVLGLEPPAWPAQLKRWLDERSRLVAR